MYLSSLELLFFHLHTLNEPLEQSVQFFFTQNFFLNLPNLLQHQINSPSNPATILNGLTN